VDKRIIRVSADTDTDPRYNRRLSLRETIMSCSSSYFLLSQFDAFPSFQVLKTYRPSLFLILPLTKIASNKLFSEMITSGIRDALESIASYLGR